jgi:hypothetical protein
MCCPNGFESPMQNERSRPVTSMVVFLVAFIILLSPSANCSILASQGDVLTIEPSMDSYVTQICSDSNGGNGESMSIRSFLDNEGNPFNHRIYLKFSLENLSEGAYVGSATLRLYKFIEGAEVGNRRIEVKRVLESWTEYQVTWANQPSVSGKSTDSAQIAGPDRWYEWDVTEDVRGWVEERVKNNGFCLVDSEENSSTDYASVFYSREAYEMHMYRPKLEISQTSEETKSWSLNYRFIAVIFIAAAVLLLFVARFVKTSNRSRA